MKFPTQSRCVAACLVLLLLLAGRSAAELPTVETVGEAVGLIVVVGTTDGELERGLSKRAEGRVLVHGLSLDDAARDRARGVLQEAGVYGLATVDTWTDAKRGPGQGRLPHADGLVDLLIADLDAVKALTREEAMRVVAPGFGVAFLKEGGAWTPHRRPMVEGMDEWRHSFGTAGGNAVSDDRLVGPVNTVRWIDGFGWSGGSMGGSGGRPVVGQGVLVHDDERIRDLDEVNERRSSRRLFGRDAFNGLPLWSSRTSTQRVPLAVGEVGERGVVVSAYQPKGEAGDLFVRDLRTGEVVRKLDVEIDNGRLETVIQPVVVNAVAYAAVRDRVVAWDLETGDAKWEYVLPATKAADDRDKEGAVAFSPSVTPDGTRLIFAERATGGRSKPLHERWPWVQIEAVTCLDTATGEVLWRNTDLRGLYTGHMPVTDDDVFWYATWGIGSHYEHIARPDRAKLRRDIGVLDARTGKPRWQKTKEDDDEAIQDLWVQVGLIVDNRAILSESRRILTYDLATGELLSNVKLPVVNQRCTRTRAVPGHLMTGFGIFMDFETGEFTDQNVARSGCAVGGTPAYGMIYQQSSGCGCFAMIRNHAAFARETLPEPVADADRLDTSPHKAAPGGEVAKAQEAPRSTRGKDGKGPSIRLAVMTDQPIRDSWRNNEDLPFPETEPVAVDLPGGEAQIVSVVNEHRVEARRDGRVLWAFTADARVAYPPLVHDGRVYFGGHDGWVYCLDAATGDQQWRYLLAPSHRRIVVFGQLESAWPIRNVVLLDGAISASAGRHPELDTGIHAAGLDPDTGQPLWHATLHHPTDTQWFDPSQRKPDHINWITNGPLVVRDGKLFLTNHDPFVHGGGNDTARELAKRGWEVRAGNTPD